MNTKVENGTFDIIIGPSRDTIFDACKYAYDKEASIPLNFGVAVGYTMEPSDTRAAFVPMGIRKFHIQSIEHEDGSGHNFNLRGLCEVDERTDEWAPCWKSFRFEAYYNTRTRKGHICFN